MVSANPDDITPNILDGEVDAIIQVGDLVVAGGLFTTVRAVVGGDAVTRSNLVVFNRVTGRLSQTAVPVTDGQVLTLLPAADGASFYVGGAFTNVNGVRTPRIARVSLTDGSLLPFRSPGLDGLVKDLRFSSGRLVVAGTFAKVGALDRPALTALDPTTGAPTDAIDLGFADPRVTATGRTAPLQVLKAAISPDGSRLLAIGNFSTVAGQSRPQIALIDLSGPTATLSPWATTLYQPACSNSFPTYMRDADFSPDGSYVVVATTGAYKANSTCDTITRWDIRPEVPDRVDTWRNYTGGDTTYGVGVTGGAIYAGGHMRWVNNPFAGDKPGQGAIPRNGIVALDPRNGMPLAWDPGRDRGVGVNEFTSSERELWVGDDTEMVAGEFHGRVKAFPVAGGYVPLAETPTTLPIDLLRIGPYTTATQNRIDRWGFTGTTSSVVVTGAEGGSWTTVRGGFRIDDTLYTGSSDGTFRAAPIHGSTIGASTALNLYGLTNFAAELPSITSLAYQDGRMYFTLSGSNALYMRYFTHDSQTVGATRFQIAGAVTGVTWSAAAGSFFADGDLFVAQTDGTLRRVEMARSGGDLAPTGVVTTVAGPSIDGTNWRAAAMVPVEGNAPPVADAQVSCDDVVCAFDGSGSQDPDGEPLSYSWSFGDPTVAGGGSGTGVAPSHTYAHPGDYEATLTVTDGVGATDSVTVDVPARTLPTAVFDVDCDGLVCAFDGSGSTAPGSEVASYTWDFDDGGPAGSGATTDHTFAASGVYDVTLTVANTEGFEGTVTAKVSAAGSAIEAVGSTGAATTSSTSALTVPPGAAADDVALLWVDSNPAATVTVPAGWDLVGRDVARDLSSALYRSTLTAADAGSTVVVRTNQPYSTSTALTVYRNLDTADPVAAWASSAETASLSSHTTPQIAVGGVPGAWLVSAWTDKTSATTSWTLPAEVTPRASALGTGGGRITVVTGDSAAPVTGTVGGLVATADAAATKAVTWSLILRPAS